MNHIRDYDKSILKESAHRVWLSDTKFLAKPL